MWLNDTVLPAVNLLPGWFHVPVSHICLEAAPDDEQLNLRTDVHFVHLSQRIVTHQTQHSICLCAVLPYNSFDLEKSQQAFFETAMDDDSSVFKSHHDACIYIHQATSQRSQSAFTPRRSESKVSWTEIHEKNFIQFLR